MYLHNKAFSFFFFFLFSMALTFTELHSFIFSKFCLGILILIFSKLLYIRRVNMGCKYTANVFVRINQYLPSNQTFNTLTTPFTTLCPKLDNKLHLMVKLQFWGYGVLSLTSLILHLVILRPEWVRLIMVSCMSHVHIKKEKKSYSIVPWAKNSKFPLQKSRQKISIWTFDWWFGFMAYQPL